MRTCVFCGGRANSKEHAWPDWILQSLNARLTLMYGPLKTYMEAHAEGKLVRTQPKPDIEVKRVCGACNSGWMSALENQAKPIISALMYANRRTLTRADQLTLTLWSMKTAMVFDCLRRPDRMFYLPDERASLRRGLLATSAIMEPLPALTQVWLAAYAGECATTSMAARLRGYVRMRGREIPTIGHVITISAGAFVTQVLTVRLPEHPSAQPQVTHECKPGPWDEATVCVWPPFRSEATWPPRHVFRELADLEVFSDRWPRHLGPPKASDQGVGGLNPSGRANLPEPAPLTANPQRRRVE